MQTINLGTNANSGNGTTIRNAFSMCNDNFSGIYDRCVINAMAPPGSLTPLVGDSNYTNASGTDDSTALQAMIDYAVDYSNRRAGEIWIPCARTYRLNNTIVLPVGFRMRGIGNRDNAGTATPPTFVWGGALGGTMFDCAISIQNMGGVGLQNLAFSGRLDGTNHPGCHIKYRHVTPGTFAQPDTGTFLKECYFFHCTGNSIRFDSGGATNFYMSGCRWDGAAFSDGSDESGYAIYVNAENGVFNMTMDDHCTYTVGDIGFGGFMYVNASVNGGSNVAITGLNIEYTNVLDEKYSGGTNECDKRGLFRYGVQHGASDMQHSLTLIDYKGSRPSGAASGSLILVTGTGGTDLDCSQKLQVQIVGARNAAYVNSPPDSTDATDHLEFIGGRVPYNRRPPPMAARHGFLQWGYGIDSSYTQHVENYFGAARTVVAGLAPDQRTFANLPNDTGWMGAGEIWVCTDVPNGIALGGVVTTGGGSNIRPLWGEFNGGVGYTWYLMGRAT